MARVVFEDFDMDARTRDMLVAARVVCKAPLVITQGSYNNGGVAASAGTHDGGGALDIRATNLTAAQRLEVVSWLRKVGFFASLRLPSEGNWPYHVHCIAVGCPDLSRGAKAQVTAYLNGRNGLANNGPDKGTRAWVDWTWERYKKTYPNLLVEDPDMTPAESKKVLVDYFHGLYDVTGTEGIWHREELERDAAQLQATTDGTAKTVAAVQAASTAQVAALNNLTVAVAALTKVLNAPKV